MRGDYRPNVAAIILNHEGKMLVCERTKQPGAWQFPQGGIDPGESAEEAIFREVEEEVGYAPADYEIEEVKGTYKYDYPAEVLDFVRRKRNHPYIGQEQTYFLCRVKQDAPEPKLDGREFSRYQWIPPEAFHVSWLPPFKSQVYRDVLMDFFEVEIH